MGAPFLLFLSLAPLALAIYYPTRSFYPILQPMWQAMCHSPGSCPLSPPAGIDQWTYSWPQNFGTGHKLHKTKPNQTGQAAEEAAMKCIAMRLSFISCGQRAGGGGKGCKSVPHILRFQISAACATPHTRVCHFGSSRKRNYRKSEFKAKWPMALALANVLGKNCPTRDKNFASQSNKEGDRER